MLFLHMGVPITKEMKERYKNMTVDELLDSALPDQILIAVIDPDFEKKYGDMFQDSQSSSNMPESAPNPIIRLIQRMRARFK